VTGGGKQTVVVGVEPDQEEPGHENERWPVPRGCRTSGVRAEDERGQQAGNDRDAASSQP
jgi:hypothetical protein